MENQEWQQGITFDGAKQLLNTMEQFLDMINEYYLEKQKELIRISNSRKNNGTMGT